METKPDIPAAAIPPSPPPKQRIGTIMLATATVEASWEMLCQTLFNRFCPFAIHVSPDGSRRAYVGFCAAFKEIPPDAEPPRYVFTVKTSSRGGREVSFSEYVPEPHPEQDMSPPSQKE